MTNVTSPILITGCARSGTSLVAGIISHCGAFGGKLSGATRYNQKGMFENAAIRNVIVKPFLRSIGADAMGQDPLPDIESCRRYALAHGSHWRDKIISIMRGEGYASGPWFYKGAKICLMWQIWDAAFPGAKWVLVRRKDKDIINSCLRTGFMRAYRTTGDWQAWIDEHKRRFDEMKAAGFQLLEVWPEDLVDGDLTVAERLMSWCGLTWNPEAVTDFISPRLWKNGLARV